MPLQAAISLLFRCTDLSCTFRLDLLSTVVTSVHRCLWLFLVGSEDQTQMLMLLLHALFQHTHLPFSLVLFGFVKCHCVLPRRVCTN